VDPRLFTVSSIFCLIEDDLFVESFNVFEPGSSVPSTDSDANDMMKNLSNYWKGMRTAAANSGKGGDGATNPDNPFILGYGLMQDIQNLANINPDASWENTPAFMIPNSFDLTTTKASSLPGLNTLNYCMTTHTSKNPGQDQPRQVDNQNDRNAGRLEHNFFGA